FDCARVRIEQQLVPVAALSLRRVVWAVHAEAVPLAGSDAGRVSVPGEAGDLRQVDAGLFSSVVEETQLDLFGELGEEGEVGAGAVERGAERISAAWLELHSGRVWRLRGRRDPGFAGGASASQRPVRGLLVRLGGVAAATGRGRPPGRPGSPARA